MSPHANVSRRLHRLIAVAAVVLAPTTFACVPSPVGGAGALPAVVATLDLAAYPKARLISQEAHSENIGFIERPGRSASRLYETNDAPPAIRAHYERLAKTHGWRIEPLPEWAETDYSYGRTLASLSKGNYQFDVRFEDDYNPEEPIYADPPYGSSPTPWPSDFESADPSTWPSPEPTATPTPLPKGPFRIRINAHMN
jgi:hypothetical protein